MSHTFVDTNNLSRGMYIWDPNCNLPDNGLTILCPPELQVPHTQQIGGNGVQQLNYGNIIFGSLVLSNGTNIVTDWRLHGHSSNPQVPSPNNEKLINHKTGQIRMIGNLPSWTASYKYAMGPGRWRMLLRPFEPLATSMWDFLSNEYNGDITNWSDRLSWLMNLAVEENRPLLIDRLCRFVGFLSLPHNLHLWGCGDFSTKAALILDMPRFVQYLRKDLNNYDYVNGFQTQVDRWLFAGPPMIMQHPLAKKISIKNLRITGDCLNPAIDYSWPSDKYDPVAISNLFRNSPAGSIAFMTQNNRPVEGLEVDLENVHIHHTLGSCLIGNPAITINSVNLTMGCSVSGRVSYYKPGCGKNTRLYGFTRTSIARWIGPQTEDGLKYSFKSPEANKTLGYTGLETNPWPDNSDESNIIGIVNEQKNGTYYADVYSGRKLFPITLLNVDIDTANTPFDSAITISRDVYLTGTLKNTDPNKPAYQILRYAPNIGGSIPNTSIDVSTMNSKPPAFTHGVSPSAGNWYNLKARIINDNDQFHRPVLVPPEVDPSQYSIWNSNLYPPAQVHVSRNITHPPHATQTLDLTLLAGWPVQACFWIPDLATAINCVPTNIYLRDCVFDNQYTTLVGTTTGITQTIPFGLGSKPVRVHFINCKLNWQIPRSGRGSDLYDQQLEFITMKGCTTWDGLVSEQAGTGILNENGTLTINTQLMWKPKETMVFGSNISWSWFKQPNQNHWQKPVLTIQGTPNTSISWKSILAP